MEPVLIMFCWFYSFVLMLQKRALLTFAFELPFVLLKQAVSWLEYQEVLSSRSVARAWRNLLHTSVHLEICDWVRFDPRFLETLDKRTVEKLTLGVFHLKDVEWDLSEYCNLHSCELNATFFTASEVVRKLGQSYRQDRQWTEFKIMLDQSFDLLGNVDLLYHVTELVINKPRWSQQEFRLLGTLAHLGTCELQFCLEILDLDAADHSLFPRLWRLRLTLCSLGDYHNVTKHLSRLKHIELVGCVSVGQDWIPLTTIANCSQITQLVLKSVQGDLSGVDLGELAMFCNLTHLVLCGYNYHLNDSDIEAIALLWTQLESLLCTVPVCFGFPAPRLKAVCFPVLLDIETDEISKNYFSLNALEILELGEERRPRDFKKLLGRSIESLCELKVSSWRAEVSCKLFPNLNQLVVHPYTKVTHRGNVHVAKCLDASCDVPRWVARVFPKL